MGFQIASDVLVWDKYCSGIVFHLYKMQEDATAEVAGLLRAHGWQSAGFAQKLSTATRRSSAGSTPKSCFFKWCFSKPQVKHTRRFCETRMWKLWKLRTLWVAECDFAKKMVFNLRILGKKSTDQQTPTDLTRRQPDLWQGPRAPLGRTGACGMGSNQRHRKRVSSLALAALLLCEILGKCKTKMKGLDKWSFFSN